MTGEGEEGENRFTQGIQVEEEVQLVTGHQQQGEEVEGVGGHGLAEGLADAETKAADYVLQAAEKVEGCVVAAGGVVVCEA